MLVRLAHFCYRRRRYVVIGWIVLLFALNAIAGSAGDKFSSSFSLPGTDSQRAADLLKAKDSSRAGTTGDVVLKAPGRFTDAEKVQLGALFGDVAKVDRVRLVRSPFDPANARQIAPGGTIAYAEIQFTGTSVPDIAIIDKIKSLRAQAHVDGVQIEVGGEIFGDRSTPGATEAIGLMAAIVILLVAFGSLLAMGLPILTALFGLGCGLAGVTLISHITSVPEFATQLGSMIGIGVGIDYALFIVTRYRQELKDGNGPERAVVTAVNTAGRAVLFAGLTVVISVLGMYLMKIKFVQGLGFSAAIVVLATMAASVTLLPALLGFCGHAINKFGLPGHAKRESKPGPSVWFRWSRFIQRRPWPAALAGLLILVFFAIPMFDIRLGNSDASNSPTSESIRRGFDIKAEGFGPGASNQFLLAAKLNSPQDLVTLKSVSDVLNTTPGVALASPPDPNADNTAAVIQLIPTTDGQDVKTVTLLHNLRDNVLPNATKGTGVQVYVGGLAAAFQDVATTIQHRLPIFIGAVLALSFLLLMVVFRSLLVPLKAVIMNLLSIGAAYGLMVAIFQWGWGMHLIGVGKSGPVESFLPMMLFAILFGLSMDYEVFLLSRVKEEYDRTGDNALAVADGLSATARVITAAALIMVTVFGSFVFGDQRIIKEFGLGLAFAILIDATIVRMVLVPATMELLGDANWYFPKWLEWLPRVHIEAMPDEAEVVEKELATVGV